MRLFINDIEIELEDGTGIARTKQVNDIGSLSNRQSNFTPKIKVPKTKKNKIALDHLWSTGNTSRIPYKKNTAQLINSSGEHEIYNGLAKVFDSNEDYYNLSIYDGYITFVKAIENFKLTDLNISELNHLKNLNNVLATYTDETLNYRYNVADYNGKTTYGAGILNIDYLIPSVKKKYLWDKIFEFFGFTYSGNVFDTEDFINNWMSYPKPINEETQVLTFIHTWNWNGTVIYASPSGSVNFIRSTFFTHAPLLNNSQASSNGVASDNAPAGTLITVVNSGLYKFEFDGVIGFQGREGESTNNPITLRYGDFNDPSNVIEIVLNDNYTYNEAFSFFHYQQFEAGDEFALLGAASFTGASYNGDLDITISKVEGNSVDFQEAFIDFNVKDFVDEILWEFSLTPFKDKYTNNIVFLTHKEWLESIDNYDFSSDKNKFVSKKKEKYVLSGYAQRNWLKHKYNDENSDYNNGSLTILNENLKEQTTIIQSKVYTPEKNKSFSVGFNTNVYKIWDKEVEDDGSIKYKDLDKRFYFMRSVETGLTTTFGSETEGISQSVTGYYVEGYTNLKFRDIVNRSYKPIYSILNSSKLVTAEIYFNDIDISNLDFKKLVFIKELGSYYILNKIPNYRGKGVYTTELIEVDYLESNSEIGEPEKSIIIDSFYAEANPPFTYNAKIVTNYDFLNYTPDTATIYARQLESLDTENPVYTGFEFIEDVDLNDNINRIELPQQDVSGWYEVIVIDNELSESNKEYVLVGAFDGEDPSPTPSIELIFDFDGTDFSEHQRGANYKFNNFTPATAVIKIQKADFNTNKGTGETKTATLNNLAADTNHSQLVTIPVNAGYIYVRIETDSLILEKIYTLL